MYKIIATIAICVFAATGTASAEGMQKYVKAFEEVEHLAQAHCDTQFGDSEACMDRQFNAFIEMHDIYVSDAVSERALRHATTYSRDGKVKSFDFREALRKAKLYHVQEKMNKYQNHMGQR